MGLGSGLLALLVPILTGHLIGQVIPSADRSQLWPMVLALVAAALSTAAFSVVRGIVDAHRGRIHVDSELGKGTEIRTLVDLQPKALSFGPGCFSADGIYLGAARIDRGRVSLPRS